MPWLRNSLTPAAIFRGRTFILVGWECVCVWVRECARCEALRLRRELSFNCAIAACRQLLLCCQQQQHWGNSNTEATTTLRQQQVQFSLGPCTGTSTFGHNCMLMHETLIACPRDATRRPNGLCHHQRVSPCNVPPRPSQHRPRQTQLHFTI